MRRDVVQEPVPPFFFGVVGKHALPARDGDATALTFVGQVIAGRVHALVHRLKTDGLFAEPEYLAEVVPAVAYLHHSERWKHHRAGVHGAYGVVKVPADPRPAVEAQEFGLRQVTTGPAFAA